MTNANCRFGRRQHFAFGINHFAFCISPPRLRRSAISLTEVLISMGILTLGLLGVAALFPVGGFYMQKAEIADRGSAIAQSVMSDLMARGMLNPRAWMVIVPSASAVPSPANQPFTADTLASPTGNAAPATFTRPFGLALNEALSQPEASTNATLIGKQFGSAFVIDPQGVAKLAFPSNPPAARWNMPAATFPATAFQSFNSFYPTAAGSPWNPWAGMWPIRRVTFQQPTTGWQMEPQMAEHMFRGSDDLVTDFPDRDDRPATQNWDSAFIAGNQAPLARQWTGDYLWIVTVAPTTKAARDGMGRDPESHAYDVSVVVFYKRVLPDDAQSLYLSIGASLPAFFNAVGENERAVRASVISTGPTGGELLLTDLLDGYAGGEQPEDSPQKSPFRNLKAAQWVMLCGPHPNSSNAGPRFVLNWYQVLAIDTEGLGIPDFNPITQRVVTLRGPQWPWQPGTPISENLCVGMFPGAVAVHTKTMRLESPRSSAMKLVPPPAAPKNLFNLY